MKLSTRKIIASLGAATLLSTLAVAVVPAANAAAPTCSTVADVEICNGTLANGAAYTFRMPSKFGGTMFFWEHGFRQHIQCQAWLLLLQESKRSRQQTL
jgi:hypothetical protein